MNLSSVFLLLGHRAELVNRRRDGGVKVKLPRLMVHRRKLVNESENFGAVVLEKFASEKRVGPRKLFGRRNRLWFGGGAVGVATQHKILDDEKVFVGTERQAKGVLKLVEKLLKFWSVFTSKFSLCDLHGKEVESPNDPKLSDRDPEARVCAKRREAKARHVLGFMAGAHAVTEPVELIAARR